MPSAGPAYGRVYHRIWSSKWFRSADNDTRLAALYLLTCPHNNTEGLFRLPVLFAQYELDWEPERVTHALNELEAIGFILWDPDNDLIFIRNAMKWQTPAGHKSILGAFRKLQEAPTSWLLPEFLDMTKLVCPDLGEMLAADRRWVTNEASEQRRSEQKEGASHNERSPIEGASKGHFATEEASPHLTSHSPRAHKSPPNPPASQTEGGWESKTLTRARAKCEAQGWTPEEIHQRLADIADDPLVDDPTAVAVTRLRAMATEEPPGMFDNCATCLGDGWVITEDGAEPCPPCDGKGRHPRTQRQDQEAW